MAGGCCSTACCEATHEAREIDRVDPASAAPSRATSGRARASRRSRSGGARSAVTASIVALVREGILLALLLAAPLLVAALVAGVISGLIGAFTQIQDPAVGLVPRVLAVGVAIVLF